jgi:endonuclease/exonuclease/phosphatase family metal-dependent hydrolase
MRVSFFPLLVWRLAAVPNRVVAPIGMAFARGMASIVLLGAMQLAAADTKSPSPASATLGVAAFNMAWAGTADEFKRHVQVCAAPSVNWCDTRARIERGASAPTDDERKRADTCQQATLASAGGRDASMMVAPCNAYRSSTPPTAGQPRPDPNLTRTPTAYEVKLDQLALTVKDLIERENVKVIAFQEVSGVDVVKRVLGKHANDWDACAAKHNAFQTIAFAWDKRASTSPGACNTDATLAVLDPPTDPAAFRRVRPGLALTLNVNGAAVSFLNVHLKSGCASVNDSNPRFPGRLLDAANDACEVLNRQVAPLENWIEAVAAKTPRLVLLGDFNRRIDDEETIAPAKDKVRADGSDPASPNKVAANGKVATRYLWQELSDGTPTLHQVALSTSEGGCKGFQGLDHIVISDALKRLNPGVIASKKIGVLEAEGQLIETSDHCPRVAQLRF